MVQREVADRVAARPARAITGCSLSPCNFTARRNASSRFPRRHLCRRLRCTPRFSGWRFAPRFAELRIDERVFLGFLRTCFAQKRKTLANNLRAAGLPPEAIAAALARAQVAPQARAEALPIEAFASLWHSLQTSPSRAE